jgi:hypothetical protein
MQTRFCDAAVAKFTVLYSIGDFIRQTSNPLPHVFTVMRLTSPWTAGSSKKIGRKLAVNYKTNCPSPVINKYVLCVRCGRGCGPNWQGAGQSARSQSTSRCSQLKPQCSTWQPSASKGTSKEICTDPSAQNRVRKPVGLQLL